MSTTYPNLTSTNFPDAIDDFDSYVDPQIEDMSLINQYYNFIEQNNLNSANQILIDNPSLIPKIVNAARLNHLRDGLIAVENYCRDNTPYYATCSTNQNIAAKVATTTNGNFVLKTGATVNVKFSHSHTGENVATLNVDNTGAKNIVLANGTTATQYCWVVDEWVNLMYDGVNWVMTGKHYGTRTYYGLTKLEDSTTSTSTSTALTPSALNNALNDFVAPLYSNSLTYSVGDIVRGSSNSLYRCNTAITTPEQWNTSHWTVLPSLPAQIATKQDILTFDATPRANSTNPVTSNGIYNALQDAGIGLAPTFQCTYGITTRQEIFTAITRKQCIILENVDMGDIEQGTPVSENFITAYLTYKNSNDTVYRFTTIYNDTIYTFTIGQNDQWSYAKKAL